MHTALTMNHSRVVAAACRLKQATEAVTARVVTVAALGLGAPLAVAVPVTALAQRLAAAATQLRQLVPRTNLLCCHARRSLCS